MKAHAPHNFKILIINPFGIGDVIFSTPLIAALKDAYPDSSLGYICNKRAYEAIRSNPSLDNIFVFEKDEYRDLWNESKMKCLKRIFQFLKAIKREKFDIVIDLSLGYQYDLLLKFAGIRRRVGFNYRNRGKFLTSKIDIEGFEGKHVIEYYLDILKLLGIDPNKYRTRPKVYLTDENKAWADNFLKEGGVSEKDTLIGVIPGCGASWGQDAKYRRWDRSGFAKVCDCLVERYNAKIVLLGSANELEICTDVRKMMQHAAINACGKTDVGNFLGLVRRCRLIITNDGGPLHMAIGIGTKTVSIFGPVDEKIYGPYPPGEDNIVVSMKGMACRPCYKRFRHSMCEDTVCLKEIKPEDVLRAANILLSGNTQKADCEASL